MLSRLATLARQQPHAVMLRGLDGAAELSFAQCYEQACRTAAWLREAGAAPGDRVLLLAGNRPLFLYVWLGAMALGAIPVPIHPETNAENLAYLIEHSGAKLLVSDRDAEPMRELADPQGRCRFVCLDEPALQAQTSALMPLAPVAAKASTIASILYTSGTTGRPKGALITNRSYLAIGERIVQGIGITSDDRIMVFLPLSHANPQMYAVMAALTAACSIVLCPRFSASNFVQQAAACGASGFTYVGTVLSILAKQFGDQPQATGLRWCVGGGAPLPVWTRIEAALGISVHELYGMTETGGMVTMNTRERRKLGSIGAARDDVEVAILDADDRPLGPGCIGEIAVRPREPFVLTAGYYNQPEEMIKASSNLWFHTGDLGRRDADGFFHFEGRSKELIRRAGEMISPVEIELAALSFGGVADCAAVGVADDILEEEIKLVAVPRPGLEPAALVRHLMGKLPVYKMPRMLELVQSIPKTGTEKVQRFQLKQTRGDLIDLRPLIEQARRGTAAS
ncbi:MAG: class I adenylate-forming enzyme family protein [Burkholderiaceae bacterium]